LLTAKALKVDGQTGAVVVSFESGWLDSILTRQIKWVIRKKVPRTNPSALLYAYVNSPTSALVARARVSRTGTVSINAALNHSKDLCLSASEIRNYFGDSREVGMYELSLIEVAKKSLSLNTLRELMIFHPPQSFFFLSKRAKLIIDRYLGFRST